MLESPSVAEPPLASWLEMYELDVFTDKVHDELHSESPGTFPRSSSCRALGIIAILYSFLGRDQVWEFDVVVERRLHSQSFGR